MKELIFEIAENNRIAENTYKMVLLSSEETALIKNPGQFVNIRLNGFFLRRPISVCDWNEKNITLIYKVVGKGTEAMSRYKSGKQLDVLIPLGNGYDISKSGDRPLLAGGGAGVPPMYGLCKCLKEEGKSPVAVLGFNSAKDVFYQEEFHQLGVDVVTVTADGSVGAKGFVTDVLENLSYNYFYACGPEAMLKALDSTIDSKIDGQLSFEERMGCGFGACMGCSCETKYGNKRICKDGPVLERSEIIW